VSRTTRQLRFGTSYNVDFPDFPSFDIQPSSFKLTQVNGNHDILELTYPTLSPIFLKTLKTGALVRLRWKNDKSNAEFVGHVLGITPLSQSTKTRNPVITCIGASLKMKEGGNKVWNLKTASEIAALIAKDCGLKANVSQTPVRYSQQYLVGQTHWEKIKELAYRSGCVIKVVGTTLYFHPLDKMIDAFITNTPILSHEDTMYGALSNLEGQTLDTFKPTTGDINLSASNIKRNKTVSGIETDTGKPFSYTASPNDQVKNIRATVPKEMFEEIIPERVSENPIEAKAMAEAEARLAAYSMFAEGQAQGDPRISPYKTVEINGTGAQTDGSWVITKSVHSAFKDGRYITTFECMSDGTGLNKASATRPQYVSRVGARNIANENLTGIKIKQTPAKISAPTPLVNQTQAGYKTYSRKWV
jgi:phage protein D